MNHHSTAVADPSTAGPSGTAMPGRRLRPPTRSTLLTPQFLALALATLAYFTADGILIAAVPRFVAGPLGAGNIAVGLVVGAFSVSAFFLRPWAGRLGDRRGRRPLMVVGAGVFAVSVLGYVTASDPAVLAALRLLTGAGEAFFFVGALTAFTDVAPPDRRGEAMSLASLSLYVGIGVGPLLGELAIDRAGFTAAWLLAAVCALAALAAALRTPETRPALPAASAGDEPAGHRLVHPAGVLPGLVLLASILGMAGFLAFVPLYALDLGMTGSSGVLLVFAGVVVGIRGVGARIPDRLGAARATRLALGLSAIGLATAGSWQSPTGLFAGAIVLGVGIALLTPSVFTLAVERVAPQERAAVMGTTSAFLDLAFGLGPAGLGVVAASVGRPGTFVAGAVVAAAGLVLVVAARLGRPPRPHRAATSHR
ncbi:MAG TPA: MFS transporter [Egibacteraceae bacterium]|nr:MFS transporter [Egibacteraceae bacterium]